MAIDPNQGDLFQVPNRPCESCGAEWDVDERTGELYMQHTFDCQKESA